MRKPATCRGPVRRLFAGLVAAGCFAAAVALGGAWAYPMPVVLLAILR